MFYECINKLNSNAKILDKRKIDFRINEQIEYLN